MSLILILTISGVVLVLVWLSISDQREDNRMRARSTSWAERHYPAELRDVAGRVMFCVMITLEEDPNRLTPTSAFIHDIDVNDLADVELVMSVEEEFGISIPEQDAQTIQSIGALIDYIYCKIRGCSG